MKKGIFGRKHTESPRKKPLKVFGVPLAEVCQRDSLPLPTIVTETIEFIENKGLQKEGIFRISGNSTTLDLLRAFYDGEAPPDFTGLDKCDDVHAACGLLKLYLSKLPESLLTFRFYDNFIQTHKNQNNDPMYYYTTIRKLISGLPQCHKLLLIRLIKCLHQVVEYSEVNKMSFANLAIVVGPTILRPQHESNLCAFEDNRHVSGVVQSLLEEFDYLVLGTADKPKSIAFLAAEQPVTDAAAKFDLDPSLIKSEELLASDAGPVSAKDRIAAMRDKANRKRAFLGHTNNNIPTPATPAFNIANPLSFATENLKARAAKENRPFDITTVSNLTPKQLLDEKIAVKWELRNFDLAFQACNGHLPTKKHKEQLKPLYDRYKLLSEMIAANDSDPSKTDEIQAPPPLVNKQEYEQLLEEKKKLQRFLKRYEVNFMNKTRRKIQYLQDREPVKNEFKRYKEIKDKVTRYEEASKENSENLSTSENQA